jgi:rubrerythrin
LSGDIVEGGTALEDLFQYIHSIQKYGCINLLDLALDIEFVSYDLYRTMANLKMEKKEEADILISIAQAEKNHMELISESYARCRQ